MIKRARSQSVRRCGVFVSLLLSMAAATIGAHAQNPILDFSFEGGALAVPVRGSGIAVLHVENTSVHEADDIEVAWSSGPIELSPVDAIDVLAAFSEVRVPITVSPNATAVEGQAEAVFELSYTYCVDDLCFQIIEDIALPLTIEAAVTPPANGQIVDPPADVVIPVIEESGPSLLLPLFVGGALVAALIAGQVWGRRWWVVLLLFATLATGLGYGIVLKQDQQAQSIGAILCTSCVGIEVTPHEDPELSDDALQRIAALDGEIKLLLFTATWCHACPYAKAMAQQAVDVNPLITIQLIDVDVEKDAADRYGIIQSGRTIVPAILRVDTGEVVFGIEDLEGRLLALLEESL